MRYVFTLRNGWELVLVNAPAEHFAFLRYEVLNRGPCYPVGLINRPCSSTRVKACTSTRRLARFLLRKGRALRVVTQLYEGMEYHIHVSACCAAFSVQVTAAVRGGCLVSCSVFCVLLLVGVFCGLSFPVV